MEACLPLEYAQEKTPAETTAMLSPEEIQARLREKPFRPMRIVASEGLRFDIKHPDLVRVTRVARVHVVALEDLPATQSPSGNGASA